VNLADILVKPNPDDVVENIAVGLSHRGRDSVRGSAAQTLELLKSMTVPN